VRAEPITAKDRAAAGYAEALGLALVAFRAAAAGLAAGWRRRDLRSSTCSQDHELPLGKPTTHSAECATLPHKMIEGAQILSVIPGQYIQGLRAALPVLAAR